MPSLLLTVENNNFNADLSYRKNALQADDGTISAWFDNAPPEVLQEFINHGKSAKLLIFEPGQAYELVDLLPTGPFKLIPVKRPTQTYRRLR